MNIKSKRKVKKSKMLDKKIWLARPGIEPGLPEDTKTICNLSSKIKTKNPGNFVTPTADKRKYLKHVYLHVKNEKFSKIQSHL